MKNFTLPQWAVVGLWYGSSIICTNSSKTLTLMGWTSNGMTLAQLIISIMCSFLAIASSIFPYAPLQNAEEWTQTVMLSFFFVGGFVTLNMAFGLMHVSLVMTMRATEALFTALVFQAYRPSEGITFKTALALIPVIFGAGLSAAESTDATFMGILVICIW